MRALDGVDLEVRPGEVHGLLGENGSGKSTLIKVLAGFHDVDAGTLEVSGTPVALPPSPGTPAQLGLQFVHQDLGLIESLTAVENLRLTDMGRRRLRISWAAERRRAAEIFDRYGLDLDPAVKVGDARPVERAQLAIIRAVEGMRSGVQAGEPARGLLVLDEPTVFLPRDEVEGLFALVREIVADGASVLFVSHDIAEVRQITDRVTVLRDGRVAGTAVTADTSERELVKMIIGRELGLLTPERDASTTSERVTARVIALSGGQVGAADFTVHAGEVLGLTGLAGSGFEDVPYFLFGARTPDSGVLELDGREHDLTSTGPAAVMRAGLALVPGDRQNDGSVPTLSVTDNMTVPVLDRHRRGPVLRRRAMTRTTARLMGEYDVRPCEPSLPYAALSGGNQQKALIAKWLQTTPRLLLLHEPTQGVDVGARQQIFEVVRQAAADDRAVVCASADHEQLAAVCDRVLVFGHGRITSTLTGADLTKERITEQCFSSFTQSVSATTKGPE